MSNYNEMLKQVRADIAKLEPQYQALKETERGLAKLARSGTDTLGITIARGTFKDLTARMAVLKCLKIADQPLKTRQLSDLIAGAGFSHGSKDFTNSLNATLARQYKVYKEIDKKDDGWQINEQGLTQLKAQKDTFSVVAAEH